MTAPTIVSVTPNRGNTIGETFVRIIGTDFNVPTVGTLKVFFGTKEALEVGVISPTEIMCLSPGGDVDEIVSVTVENSTEPGPVLESDTLVDAFTYKRPDLSTDIPRLSNIALVTSQIIADFRRTVIREVSHHMHPDYADEESAAVPQEKQAKIPNIKIIGPVVEMDRFYSFNDRQALEPPIADIFQVTDNIVSGKLTYNLVGIAGQKGYAMNLWTAVMRYFNKTPFLQVFRNGQDDTEGVIRLEQNVLWEQAGDFGTIINREGIHQFELVFEIRGVPVLAEKIAEGHTVTEDVSLDTVKFDPNP